MTASDRELEHPKQSSMGVDHCDRRMDLRSVARGYLEGPRADRCCRSVRDIPGSVFDAGIGTGARLGS